jgi:hypothetical protein
MIAGVPLSGLALAAAMLLGGAGFGLLYFMVLRCAVDAAAAARGWAGPVPLTALRLVGATIVFGLAVQLGAVALLACFLGFLAARTIALRSARRVA